MKHHLKALKAKMARFILPESELAALEKSEAEKEVQREFETECPRYCGAQDTFYVGTLKGVGRVYQQTFIDTYAKPSAIGELQKDLDVDDRVQRGQAA
jgi:hypothetical protein